MEGDDRWWVRVGSGVRLRNRDFKTKRGQLVLVSDFDPKKKIQNDVVFISCVSGAVPSRSCTVLAPYPIFFNKKNNGHVPGRT